MYKDEYNIIGVSILFKLYELILIVIINSIVCFNSVSQCETIWARAKIIRLPRNIKHRENGLSLDSMEFNQVAHLVFLMIEEIGNQQKTDNTM